MRSDTVRHGHIWNNLPLHFKGLTLLLIPLPGLMMSAVLLSGTLREERLALDRVDRAVAGRRTLQEISSVLLVPGNPAQDYKALTRFAGDLGAVNSDPDRVHDVNVAIEDKLQALAALSGAGSPDSSLWEKNQEATESLQSYVGSLALEYDQVLAQQLSRVKQARAKLFDQTVKGLFVFFLSELLAALVFLGAVTEQIHTLKANSRRLAEGEPLAPLFTDNWELNQIGRDLVTASVALDQRQREGESQRTGAREVEYTPQVPASEGLHIASSDLRQRNQDLAAALAQSRQALEVKGRFLADLSRELRIPLSSIFGFSELLYDGKLGAVSEQQKGCLSDILAGAKRLLQLADSVVGASRTEPAPAPASPELVDLERLAQEVHYSLLPVARKKGVRVTVRVDPEARKVKAEIDRLKQLFYQYLQNAIQFTPHDASLDVCLRPDSAGTLRMEVQNTGMGMASRDVIHLFPEFQAVEQNPSLQLSNGDDRTRQGPSLFYAILPGSTRTAETVLTSRQRNTETSDTPASTFIH